MRLTGVFIASIVTLTSVFAAVGPAAARACWQDPATAAQECQAGAEQFAYAIICNNNPSVPVPQKTGCYGLMSIPVSAEKDTNAFLTCATFYSPVYAYRCAATHIVDNTAHNADKFGASAYSAIYMAQLWASPVAVLPSPSLSPVPKVGPIVDAQTDLLP